MRVPFKNRHAPAAADWLATENATAQGAPLCRFGKWLPAGVIMQIRFGCCQCKFALVGKVGFYELSFWVPTPIDNALRRAITQSGLSANELCRLTGVPQSTISRFLAGADMRISKASKIAAYLGLSLTKKS